MHQQTINLHELGLITQSTWETIYMVFIATVVAVVGGILLGILLYITKDSKNLSARTLLQASPARAGGLLGTSRHQIELPDFKLSLQTLN